MKRKFARFMLIVATIMSLGMATATNVNANPAAELTPDAHTVLLDHFNGSALGSVYGTLTFEDSLTPYLNLAANLEPGTYIRYDLPSWYCSFGGYDPVGKEGTIELWIKPEEFPASMLILQWYQAAAPPSEGYILGLGLDNTGKLALGSWSSIYGTPPPPPEGYLPIGTTALHVNGWTHVAASWGPAGTKLYVNGVLDGYTPFNNYPALGWQCSPYVYAYLNSWGETTSGSKYVDELHISSIQRTDAEILTNYQQTRPLTLTVNTLDDELNSDGDCSLHEAIKATNDNIAVDACSAGDAVTTDTISFAVSGTITLAAQLEVTAGGPLVIDGGGTITVSGGGSVRVLYIQPTTSVTVENLTITNGLVYSGDNGGGIYNAGTLNMANSTLSNNRADGTQGGGIYNTGTLNIAESTLAGNIADDEGEGGGIYNAGTLTITNSTLSGNGAYFFGGGIANDGMLTITNSTLSGNSTGRFGGGIDNNGTLTITNSTFSGNSTGRFGGGIYNFQGVLTITNSTFSGNSASVFGGGIFNLQDTLTITNSTFAGNSANELGGAIYSNSGDGGEVVLSSSIIASGPSGSNCAGLITDAGYNIEDTNTCGLNTANGSLPDTDPRLGPLQDNGGSTLTHALLFDSPAIDQIPLDQCMVNTDQRDVPRPRGLGCDIGAFELYGIDATVDITPNILNVPSKNEWVIAYIELPHGYSVTTIDLSTVVLQGAVSAVNRPTKAGDHDRDGIPDLMVRFSHKALMRHLGGVTGELSLLVTGTLRDGTPFQGSDTVVVRNPGTK